LKADKRRSYKPVTKKSPNNGSNLVGLSRAYFSLYLPTWRRRSASWNRCGHLHLYFILNTEYMKSRLLCFGSTDIVFYAREQKSAQDNVI